MTGPPEPPSPPPAPETPQPYGGPVPPGGWHRPAAGPAFAGDLAGWWPRVWAYLVDGLIVGVPALVILALLGFGLVAGEGTDTFVALVGATILTVLVIVVIAFLYAPLLMMREGARNGQTLGKQWLGIRVVRDDGRPFDFGMAALREVVLKGLALGLAGSIIPVLPYLLDYFWPLWDEENRALHDMVVSTHVVKA